MDPVTAGVVAAVVLGAVFFVGLTVAWWMLRKTLSLLKRMVMLAAGLSVVALIAVGVVAALVMSA